MKKIIDDLPTGTYTGYYWLSNAESPHQVNKKFDENLLKMGIPFIVEAALYDEITKTSILIKHDGAQHEMVQYNLNEMEGYECLVIEIETHRLDGAPAARFMQIWKEEPDALCENMKTLKPYAQIFTGFTN